MFAVARVPEHYIFRFNEVFCICLPSLFRISLSFRLVLPLTGTAFPGPCTNCSRRTTYATAHRSSQTFVARLLMLEDILHHVKRMLDLGTKTRFEFLIQQRQVFFPTLDHRLDWLSALGNAKGDGVRHGLESGLDFFAFLHAHMIPTALALRGMWDNPHPRPRVVPYRAAAPRFG